MAENEVHLMHRKEQLCHTFRRKVWEMSILLSRLQFGSHIYSSVPGWVWSAPVYVRAILMKGAGLREQRINPAEVTHSRSCGTSGRSIVETRLTGTVHVYRYFLSSS